MQYLMDGLSLVLSQLETLTLSGDFTAIKTDQPGSRLFAISHSRLFVMIVRDTQAVQTVCQIEIPCVGGVVYRECVA